MRTKFVFVTGGVVSSLGKGITAASLGRLLKNRGLKVSLQKLDPYINIDPGTMSPFQHGEVFVTDDGAETDLDLGHYERFIDVNLSKNSNVTAGKVYWSVIQKERHGDYMGTTVQVIPHITNEIKSRIFLAAEDSKADVLIIEIGGTVGDIESLPFLEAIRQIKTDEGAENCMYIHTTLIPYLGKVGELKTKPTQHSVKELRSIGIQPDVIVCRTQEPLSADIKAKIALFCNIDATHVVENIDADDLYEVPLLLEKEGLGDLAVKKLKLECKPADMLEWSLIAETAKKLNKSVTVALVGKYVKLHDAYLSIVEALKHGGLFHGTEVKIKWIDSEIIEKVEAHEVFNDVDAILIPGGFGERGIDGKIRTAQFARVNNIPYFGICLGMQVACIEFARNVAGLMDGHSTEFDPCTKNPVIDLLPGQKEIHDIGGTMRLGSYPCMIIAGTKASAAFDSDITNERHRHRFEFNNQYKELLSSYGLVVSGVSPDLELVEMVEIESHPWFVGVQFHPEFKSRPNKPHPLFKDFIGAAIVYKNRKLLEIRV